MKKFIGLVIALFFFVTAHTGYSQYSPDAFTPENQKFIDNQPSSIKADLHLLWSQKTLPDASQKDAEPEKTKRKSQYINWAAIGLLVGTAVGFGSDVTHPLYGAIYGGLIGLGVDILEWWIFN